MKKALITAVCLLALVQLNARVIFVKPNGAGDGSSWEKASELQAALKAAKTGDQIWVAAGKYVPTKDADRNASFVITEGIKVYGGFAGHETALAQRNVEANETILSGEIGNPDTNEDNAYTVVYTEGVSAATLLDGFTITGGMANALSEGGDRKSSGAAWFNNGKGMESSPTIANCIFIDNYAREGAAIYNYAYEGKCNPKISKCQFIRNRVDFNGGAIFNDGNDGICNAQIIDCHFEANESTYGAGIFNRASFGECKALINNCTFVANISIVKGSAVYNDVQSRGICAPVLLSNRFEDGVTTVGSNVNNNNAFIVETVSEKPQGSTIRLIPGGSSQPSN